MPFFCSRLTAVLFGCLSLNGCAGYAFSINENAVYRPPALYSDFAVADRALARCIAQTIADNNITAPEQLTDLRCSHGDIESLEGLQQFSELQRLDLADNNIRNGKVLRELKQLEYLKLSGNTELDCNHLKRPDGAAKRQLMAPQHCAQRP